MVWEKRKKLVFVLVNRHKLSELCWLLPPFKTSSNKQYEKLGNCLLNGVALHFKKHLTLLYRHTTHLVGSFKSYCFALHFNQVMNRTWHRKNIYILISAFALSYCLFKPVQLRLLALYAPGCIPFETKAYFREAPLTKRYWWTRNQSLDKWPFFYKHSSIVSAFLLPGNKYFIIQSSG